MSSNHNNKIDNNILGDQTVIKVEKLSKKYILGAKASSSFRELLNTKVKSLTKSRKSNQEKENEFWAVKDVTFNVNDGERLGIIGRNGAGKSTILKMLSRITEPTSGRISISGRVASLLEVGTGFHPELTGRENIYLNGAILGMSRKEIKSKFDEIVSFAEVEKFLDTPVKRYSSGMYVRLAFAVAAHLEPEILIVDEVLAVGDAAFQKKCLGKMKDVSSNGRTVIFVSHNMGAIEQLCNRCILLDKGQIKMDSTDVRSVIKSYFNTLDNGNLPSEWMYDDSEINRNLLNEWFSPTRIAITDKNGKALNMPVSNDTDFYISISGSIKTIDPALTVGYAIYTADNQLLYWTYHTDPEEEKWPKFKQGNVTFISKLPKHLFNEGEYRIELISSLHWRKWLSEPGVTPAHINLSIQGGLSKSPYWMAKRPGMLGPIIEWDTRNDLVPGERRGIVEVG